MGGLDPGLAWLTGDFTGSGKTQIAEPWDSAFVLVNAPQPLALNIYGDVNGSVQAVQANVELGQGVGALAWLSGDFLGSGKTQIAQLWNNNDNLALIIYGDVNGSMQTVQAIGNLGQGPGALAWLTGDFTGSGKTQIAQLWNNNGNLALIIYGDVNGSMQTVRSNGNLGQGPGALAWLTGDFTGSGKTQIAQPWNNNGQLGLIIYGQVVLEVPLAPPIPLMQTVWSTGNIGQGSGALAWLTGDFTGSGKTQIAQPWDNNGQLALIIYGDVNGSMQTVQATGNLGQGPGALAWLSGDFFGLGKTQIAQLWDNFFKLVLNIYGDVNGSMQFVQATSPGQGPGALAWLTGDFTGSGQTQIAQPWAPNPLEPF